MVIHAATFNTSGYGRAARSVLSCLGGRACSDDFLPADLAKFTGRYEDAQITVSLPHGNSPAPVHFTMYESSILPKEYVNKLNERKLIIVPNETNARDFENSGVKTRIEVCNLSCAQNTYMLPPSFSRFTFIHVSTDSGIAARKRTNDIIEAFKKAFPTEANVRLLVKKSPQCAKIANFDSRIKIITKHLTHDNILALYKQAHVGVFISGQEAWGYPHVDLMSIGRPIIAPHYCGPAEYLDETNGYCLPFSMRAVPELYFKSIGKTAWVNINTLVQKFQFCFDNKEDTIFKGVMAYRAMQSFTLNRQSVRLKEIINAYSKF